MRSRKVNEFWVGDEKVSQYEHFGDFVSVWAVDGTNVIQLQFQWHFSNRYQREAAARAKRKRIA